MIFKELHAVVIPVSDPEASKTWYEEVLGLELVKEIKAMLYVFETGGPTRVCIYRPPPEEKPGYQDGGAFANFRTEDAQATHALLQERGVKCTPLLQAPELTFFSCFDPDGNRIDVCEFGPDWLP